MNNTVNLNTANNQVNFGCKKVNIKKGKELANFFKFSNKEIELINSGRNIDEKSEIIRRESSGKILKFLKLLGLNLDKSSEISKQIERESMEDIGRFIKDV